MHFRILLFLKVTYNIDTKKNLKRQNNVDMKYKSNITKTQISLNKCIIIK